MGAALRLRFLTLTLAAGFVLALAMGSADLFGGVAAFAADTTVTVLAGDVSVRHVGADFAAAIDGDVLHEGDTIRTGADGRAVLTYFEGSSVTIEPTSELTIDAVSTASDGGTVVLMTQTFGRTWHVVTKLITGGSRYEVRTPASTASVRGTEFEVDADNDATTVNTTEGTVVQQVADALRPTDVSEVRVPAGTTQTQRRNSAPAPTRAAPNPSRKVTVQVAATNTLVVDPLGRANGITTDGKLVVQTPGAQVRRDGDTIVVTLPNLPDGRLATRVDARDAGDTDDVAVSATIEENGKGLDLQERAKSDGKKKLAGFELARDRSGATETRPLDDSENKTLPEPKVTVQPRTNVAPAATPRPTANATRTPEPTRPVATPSRTDFRTLAPRATESPRPTRSPSADVDRTLTTTVTKHVDSARELVSRLMPSLPTVSRSSRRG